MKVLENINYSNCITNLTSSIQKHFGIQPNYSTNKVIDDLLLEKDYQNICFFLRLKAFLNMIPQPCLKSEALLQKNIQRNR